MELLGQAMLMSQHDFKASKLTVWDDENDGSEDDPRTYWSKPRVAGDLSADWLFFDGGGGEEVLRPLHSLKKKKLKKLKRVAFSCNLQ